jgi:hypothetical protein
MFKYHGSALIFIETPASPWLAYRLASACYNEEKEDTSMSKTVIKSPFKPTELQAMEKTDNKPVTIHRYSSFYFAFEILEREKSFEIGKTSIPKEDIDFFSPTNRYTQQNKSESMGKLVSFLNSMEMLQSIDPINLKEQAKPLIPLVTSLCDELKISNTSYHSLLKEGLGSIHETSRLDLKQQRDTGMSLG